MRKDTTLVNSAELDIVNLVRSGTLLCEVQSRNADVFSYRVLTPAGYSVIVVKKTRINDPAGRESLRREYTALQEVDSLTRGTMHDSVPQAMLLLENEGTIFLSAVPGVPFDKILRRDANVLNTWLRAFVIARMDMIGRHIGEWLSTFHTATRVEDRKHDHDSYSFELSRLISRCHSFGLSASMLNGVERAALSLSESSRACLSPVAAMHGDFIPQNILVQKDITRVVDFASFCRQAPVYSDLARFVAYLMILGSKPFYCQSILESVTRHFFVGYGMPLDPALLRLHLSLAILRIISDSPPKAYKSSGKRIKELLLNDARIGLSRILPAVD